MSSFGHTEIEKIRDSNDEVRPLYYKDFVLKQNRHKLLVHDVHCFNAVNYYRDKLRKSDHTLAYLTSTYFTIALVD